MHTGVYESHASRAMTCGNDAMNMKAHLCRKKADHEIDVDRGTPKHRRKAMRKFKSEYDAW